MKDDPVQFACRLSQILGERPGSQGEREILRAARIVGFQALRYAAIETWKILEQGGLHVLDGSRKRTPGGVFLRLVREAASEKMRRRIFGRRAKKPAVYQSTPEFRATFAALALKAAKKDAQRNRMNASSCSSGAGHRPSNPQTTSKKESLQGKRGSPVNRTR